MANRSLQHFLNRRYLGILLLLSLGSVVLIFVMHVSGMDKTSEYYMSYEAEVLSDFYRPEDKIIEFDLGYKEYYWGIDKLSKRYRELIKNQALPHNEVSLYQLALKDVYILPFYVEKYNKTFFVIHLFNQENFIINGSLQNTMSFIAFITLLITVVYIFKTNRHVVVQIESFHQLTELLTNNDNESITKISIPTDLYFEELVSAANSLKASLLKQEVLQQSEIMNIKREQEFLSSLSHELRTPIAIISAATALILKRDDLNSKDKSVIKKLVKANSNMKMLTQTLLELWRRQENAQGKQFFFINELIEQAIADCHELNQRRQFTFEFDNHVSEKQAGNIESLKIIINNLLRNACQYSDDGVITISANNDGFCISNHINNKVMHNIESNEQSVKALTLTKQNYGYGLGLYLVEKICQQQKWQFDIKSTAHFFAVTIVFANKA